MRSTMAEQREWRMGVQCARFEPPDILWMKFQGSLSLEEARWLVNLCQELGSQQAFFVVVDLTENIGFDPEARRYVSEHTPSEWFAGVIYIGARLIHKAAAKGISLVQRMLGKVTPPVYFVSTEEEARETIAQLRRAR
jgi:hypothetical protein